MKDKYVKVCPRCGSTDIGFDGFEFAYTTCKDCKLGYRNSNIPIKENQFKQFIEVKESELENFRKELKKQNKKPNEKN